MAEIIAGILIGPQVLDLVRLSAPLEVFADVGLVFLFFLAGLEITFDARRDRHLGLVGIAFLASLVLAVAVALGFEAVELVESPLLVAIVLAATSFGIVVAVLKDAHRTDSAFGQLVIAAASMADFATVDPPLTVLLAPGLEPGEHDRPAGAVRRARRPDRPFAGRRARGPSA